MDTTKTITHIGLCAGYGGIELGLARVLPTLRSVALCEIEAFPIANLVAKMEEGLMESAPIWTDLKTFPWESFRDRVDILTGGYPCQPFSAAGKRAGKEDPRHLWPWIADGIRILRPRVCFFENVEGHISLGLSSVISDLEELGYKVSWGIFSAAEVGAPHQRKRVFILAHSIHGGRGQEWLLGRMEGIRDKQENNPSTTAKSNSQLANGNDKRLEGVWECCSTEGREAQTGYAGSGCNVWPSRPGQPQHGWEPPRVVGTVCQKLADFCTRDSQQGGDSSQASGKGTRYGHQSEDPMSDRGSSFCGGGQRNEPPRVVGNTNKLRLEEHGLLNASVSVGSSGGPDGEAMGNADHGRLASGLNARSGTEADRGGQSDIEQAEPRQAQLPLGGNPDGTSDWMDDTELYTTCDNRTDELRLLGNGVVPATAERAFRTLIKKLL